MVSTFVDEPDSDGDDLDDGADVVERAYFGHTYFSVETNPRDPDTDGDGIEDGDD